MCMSLLSSYLNYMLPFQDEDSYQLLNVFNERYNMLYLQNRWSLCAFLCEVAQSCLRSIQVFVHCGVSCDSQTS